MSTLDNDDKKWLKKNLITRSHDDVNSIKSLIKESVNDAIDERKLVTKDDINHLPTKNGFYKRMDKLMDEVKSSRQENAAYSAQVKRLTDKMGQYHPSN